MLSKKCQNLTVIYNMSNVKKLTRWTMEGVYAKKKTKKNSNSPVPD